MMTYRSWTWHDSATEEQMESPVNKAAIDRLANEARSLYDAIPQPTRRGYDDDGDGGPEFDSDEEYEEWKKRRSEKTKDAWGQLEAIEELMGARGARFARDYEHWNEDEKMMEYLERDRDE